MFSFLGLFSLQGLLRRRKHVTKWKCIDMQIA